MLKKTITFKDLDGNDVTEDFYFNVSKAEVAEMELSKHGGMSEWLKRVVKSEDGAEIVKTFKDIIMMSVGQRSDDGRRFIKNQEIRDAFFQTDAYSTLFMELVTDAKKGGEFIRGIVPADLSDKIDEQGNLINELQLPDGENGVLNHEGKPVPKFVLENRAPTQRELVGLSKDELTEAFRLLEEQHKRLPSQ